MLLQSGAGVDRQCPRGWAALAAGGVLSAAVLLSGLGIASAQDEKPQPPKKTEKVEKVKEKIEKAKQEAERAARDAERAGGQDVAAIKKAIAEAAREGDVGEVRRLAGQLERAMAGQRGDRPRDPARPRDGERPRDPNRLRDPQPPQPPRPPQPPKFPGRPGDPFGGFDAFDAPNAEHMKKAMEQAERALKEAMERLKDNPEAQEQLQRALEAYRKGMAEGRKHATEGMEEARRRAAEAQERFRELRKANPDAPFPPGFERFGEEFGRGFGGGFGGGFDRRPGSPRFGVMVSPVTEALAEQLDLPTDRGVVVVQVMPGSVAAKAGLKKNDVILSFAGQEIGGDVSKFAGAVEKAKAGETVEAVVLRKGKKETLKGIELPEAPKRDRKPGADFEFKAPGKREFKSPEGRQFKIPAPGKSGFEKMQVQISNDEFTIDATKGDTRYRLTGSVEGGKANPSQIKIGDESYKWLKDVPEEHQDAVKQLLGSVGGGR